MRTQICPAKKTLAKGRSPPQELEVCPRSGPYLLVYFDNTVHTVLSFITDDCQDDPADEAQLFRCLVL